MSRRNCMMAPCSIGPRHTTASPGGTRKPIDMIFSPSSSMAWIRLSTTSGRSIDAEQVRNAGTIDVGVHQAHAAAGALQPVGDARRHGALADAALAGADGDHALGAEADLAQLLRGALVHGQRDRDLRQRGKLLPQQLHAFGLRLFPERGRVGRQAQRQRQPAVGQLDVVHLVQLGDATARFRILELGQRRHYGRFIDFRGAHGFLLLSVHDAFMPAKAGLPAAVAPASIWRRVRSAGFLRQVFRVNRKLSF